MRLILATSYRVLLAISALVVGVLQALVANKVVHWSPLVVVVVAGAFGGVVFLDNLRLIRHKLQAHERHAARSRMHQPLIGALNAITTARGVELRMLGISVFAIRRTWYMKWHLLPCRKSHLKRLFRFRLSEHPAESLVDWTVGKGTIGECWKDGVPVLHDRRGVAAQYGRGNYPMDDASFAQLDSEQRCGFTRTEFVQTIDKYGEILAVPIKALHTGELIGVLSIDCLAGAYASPSAPSVLTGADIEEIAGGAAFLIREDVPKF